MNNSNLKAQYAETGYVVVPQIFEASRISNLRTICDNIFEQWLKNSSNPAKSANLTNMAYLTEPQYFEQHPEQLTTLLEIIADEKILEVLAQTFEGQLLFQNTQYFFEPQSYSREGDWHRDQQFGIANEEIEKARMAQTIGIHAHIALLPDSNFQYVPGSHTRWDTSAELEIRKGLNHKDKNTADMPGAVRIPLEAGDACFFSAWGIHRGNYIAGIPRRTFDVIYGTVADWATPPPTCFLQPHLLDPLQLSSRRFFERFTNTYRESWLKEQVR